MLFHITHAGMRAVTREVELYRPKITVGNTLTANSNGSLGSIGALGIDSTSFNLGAITNDAFASDAITAAKVAADVHAESADANWDEARAGHVAAGTFGEAAQVVRTGTAQAGAAGSITLDAGASANSNLYQGLIVSILSGTGFGQSRLIESYTGATKVALVSPDWDTAPASDSVFKIDFAGPASVGLWMHETPNVLVTGAVDASVSEIQSGASGALVDAVLDEAYEGTTTLRQFLRLAASALWGKLSGAATTTVAIRDEADTKDRISATVDSDGNRTAVTLDKT
jgi:hypothetical protein